MTATLHRLQPRQAGVCICGRHLLEDANEGTCVWCGHGTPHAIAEHAYRRNMENNAVFDLAAFTADRYRRAATAKQPRSKWDEDACVAAYRAWEKHHRRPPSAMDWREPPVLDNVKRPSYQTVYNLFGGWTAFLQYIADIPRDQARAA